MRLKYYTFDQKFVIQFYNSLGVSLIKYSSGKFWMREVFQYSSILVKSKTEVVTGKKSLSYVHFIIKIADFCSNSN